MSDREATRRLIDRSNGSKLDGWLVGLLNDERDLPFAHLAIQASVMIPLAVVMYSIELRWWHAALYLAVWGLVFVDRYILMLHCTSHRPLFKPSVRWLNHYIPWVLGPLMGETPETYFVHHMGMHHVEGNLPGDLSSTMAYRRDRFDHWLRYFLDFLFLTVIRLPRYHLQKNKPALARRMLVGELGFWAVTWVLMYFDPVATLVVFWAPVLIVRPLMMAGNWAQHAFIDASSPGNDYRNSLTCISSRYNRRCFNDGYHIHHHVKATAHWSEFPDEFENNRARYGAEDAVVFEGLDFFIVWLYLMVGAWGKLADAFVQLPGAPVRSRDQVIAFLKSRVQPCT